MKPFIAPAMLSACSVPPMPPPAPSVPLPAAFAQAGPAAAAIQTTLLGGIYRVAERAGRSHASEWAMTSEKVSTATMERFGVVNRVLPDADLVTEAQAFAQKVAQGPTRAYAAHKALLRAWAVGGASWADDAMFDIAVPLFETDDVQWGRKSTVDALKAGKPRPVLEFKGR